MKGRKESLGYFSRERWVHYALLVVTALILLRLVSLQVVQSSELQSRGIERRTTDQKVVPKRGSIYDAQGHVLAQSVPVKGVYADPKTLTDLINKDKVHSSKEDIAKEIADILKSDYSEILAKLNQDVSWVSLAHQVDADKADQIMALKIPGIGLNDEQRRLYPMNEYASSVLGIVNMSGHGVEGIEAYYDKDLFGKPGYESQELDTGQKSIINTAHQNDLPQSGNSLQLTLDSTIQYLVEQELDKIQATTNSDKVTILAMDPNTGKVLGMGSRPTFDPNNYDKQSAEERRNLAISMSYEPGSTFKVITGAAALEEGVVTPDKRYQDPGYLKVRSRIITNWDSNQTPHGELTFSEGMKLSSNVVLAQVGMDLGLENFYTYLKAFGFGEKTRIDIAGEESGLLVPQDQARDIDLATMSFGQANLVTPIQLLSAVSTVANGGTLYRPYIVDQIINPDGTLIKQNMPEAKRQVISKTTSKQLTEILVDVVEEGTGSLAKIPGVKVAGKTGTAQKVDPKTGKYSPDSYVASFVAYAPADDPKISILVVIDNPKGKVHQGGMLAAPGAKKILEGALRYYGIPIGGNSPTTAPASIAQPFTRPGPKEVTPERPPGTGEVVVPDLTGLTMRQTGELLGELELHFDFNGTGIAYQQAPTPGKVVKKGTLLKVTFSPLGTTR